MKQIYLILTDTGTVLSKIIRFFMKDEYAHISISLDKNLKQMYSFGRINPYNPFYGGFIQEYTDRGTFKRFYKTKAKILALTITEEQYYTLREKILEFKRTKNNYKFNIIGLFAIYFNIKIQKQNYFYCAEFIKYVTEKSGIDLQLPELVRPENFKDIKETTEVYSGPLQGYETNKKQINALRKEKQVIS